MLFDRTCPECGAAFQAKKTSSGTLRRFCNNRCAAAGSNRRHGATKTREYKSWEQLRERCNNTNHHAYKAYGGRGIRVCERWDSFERFLEDMGPRPEGFSIERVDNDGNYEPANCRWASPLEQSRNRSNVIPEEQRNAILAGIEQHLSVRQIAKSIDRSYSSVSMWIYRNGLKSGYLLNKPRNPPSTFLE